MRTREQPDSPGNAELALLPKDLRRAWSWEGGGFMGSDGREAEAEVVQRAERRDGKEEREKRGRQETESS